MHASTCALMSLLSAVAENPRPHMGHVAVSTLVGFLSLFFVAFPQTVFPAPATAVDGLSLIHI